MGGRLRCVQWLAAIFLIMRIALAQAQTYTVLHSFTRGADGAVPTARLIRDKAGNLYGTTFSGGAYGAGVVFKLDSSGNEKVLYSFTGGRDGANPQAGVVGDSAGNLYGSTLSGGASNLGVVFKLERTGKQTVLYTFTGGTDGATPSGVVLDAVGNLYGTTYQSGSFGLGVVFKLDPTGYETVLHSFSGADGANPDANVILDAAGNLYGTTYYGGTGGNGIVFKLDQSGHETVLYSFTGLTDGGRPVAGLIRDSAGNLYGTTAYGGISGGACDGYGCGVVFKLDALGKETVLYSFTGGADGANPRAGLIRDKKGNLYGTTQVGGTPFGCGDYGCGVVFRLSPTGKEKVLYTFTGGTDGGQPVSSVIGDSAGYFYGTTSSGAGGACQGGCGVAFQLKP
jgi:uncharacterized repeat protein (TIGR03803 family)